MDASTKKAICEEVTRGLIDQMAAGVPVWQKPWVTSKRNQPHNGASGHVYSGFNRVYLGFKQEEFGSSDPRWFTFKNVQSLDARVIKGSKSTIVVYNKMVVDDKDPDDTKTFWLMKYYRVFHASQVEGLNEFDPEDDSPVQVDGDEHYPGIGVLDEWCHSNLSSYEYGGDKACYIPAMDTIQMPEPDTFKRQSWYAQTLAHEIIHASGAEKRLNRLEKAGFGSDVYAKEELVAEFGAAMLCGNLSIPADMEQSAAYVKSWADRCRDEPNLLISAANQAERACNFILEECVVNAG